MRKQNTPKSLYLSRVFSKEDAILSHIRQQAEKSHVDYMQVSAYEGRILQFLCQALRVKKAVEVGTLYGYSTLMIARALPEDGELFTLDINKKRQEQAKKLMQKDPAAKKIRFLAGPAVDSLNTLKSEAPFDMLFIDADKSSYLKYLEWGTQHLKQRGLLLADNTFLFGAVYGEEKREQDKKALQVMQEFNKTIAENWISTLLPTEEGLTVGIKK